MIRFKSLPVYIATTFIDFRKGLDGLCALVATKFLQNPQEGIYVFYNRTRNKLKIIGWHSNGFVLLYKRLERGHFHVAFAMDVQTAKLTYDQFQWLVAGLDWQTMSNFDAQIFENYV